VTLKLPPIYPITDRTLSGLSHVEQVRQLIDAGATFIQIREKSAISREFYEECEWAVQLAEGSGVRIVVNDRADIAMMVGAAGVHVGQDDLPPSAVRSIAGENMLVGFSTHNLDQAVRAAELPIDYIAIGPIFATGTKTNPDPVVGLKGLGAARKAVGDFPLVAIGGINESNVRDVLAAGADSAAIVGALFSNNLSIEKNYRKLAEIAQGITAAG
jgi:thiamine-phosphate pyrophosphorylase